MERIVKYKAKGVLLRKFKNTNATEPIPNVLVGDSLETIINDVKALMVDNIKGCLLLVTITSKIEFDDENYFNVKNEYQCLGELTRFECEKLVPLVEQIK